RVSGQSLNEFIRENIWSRIGAEHDAMMAVDRAYMGVATSAMNTTLNDAALFGYLVLNEGVIDGKRIVPKHWIDAMLTITDADRGRYKRNAANANSDLPWTAYKNFWWVIDETKGEIAATGTNGQVIYINRSANLVI